MSDSFYVEKLLNMKESKSLRAVHPPNTSLRYPTEFCFLEHQECKEHGVPGFYEGTYHFLDCTQNRSTSRNLIPLSHLSNASNNSPSISNMPRRDCSENPVLKSFNSFQKHIFPKWHTISKYPEKTRNNSTFFPELTRKLSKNGDVQNRCTAILDAVPSTSKAAQQNNSTIPQQAKNSFEKLQQQMECLSRILPTERQNMSRTTCINGILNEWRQHILEMHPDHTPSSFETFKEAFMRDPMSVPVQNPNAFRGWYSQLSTSLGEPEKKEEITPESAGKKRRRTTFTSAQLIHLENNYSLENRYLTRLKRIQLAAELGLSEKQVKVWFQNRRVRDKPKEDIKVNKHMRGRKIKSQDLEVKEEMP